MVIAAAILAAVRESLDFAVSVCGSAITDDEGRRAYIVLDHT